MTAGTAERARALMAECYEARGMRREAALIRAGGPFDLKKLGWPIGPALDAVEIAMTGASAIANARPSPTPVKKDGQ